MHISHITGWRICAHQSHNRADGGFVHISHITADGGFVHISHITGPVMMEDLCTSTIYFPTHFLFDFIKFLIQLSE